MGNNQGNLLQSIPVGSSPELPPPSSPAAAAPLVQSLSSCDSTIPGVLATAPKWGAAYSMSKPPLWW